MMNKSMDIPAKASRGRKGVCAAALLIVLACANPAYAQGDAFTITANPDTSAPVYAGDVISYSIRVNEPAAHVGMTYLRVQLGEGMFFYDGSLRIESRGMEEVPPQQDDGASAPTPIRVSYTVVPGNSGFVVLSNALQAGDVFLFDAMVEENAVADIRVQSETGAAASMAHEVGVAAVAAPTPLYAYMPPDPAAEEEGRISMPLWAWAAAVVVAAMVPMITAFTPQQVIIANTTAEEGEAPAITAKTPEVWRDASAQTKGSGGLTFVEMRRRERDKERDSAADTALNYGKLPRDTDQTPPARTEERVNARKVEETAKEAEGERVNARGLEETAKETA
ncbi:MAG: hypothetical protein LBS18_06680, partial [Clostridiales bacterium]|nr:hypothetical protein [Clostridiales bacterium]